MRTILVAALLGIGSVALSSCEKQATNEVKPKRVETVVVKAAPVAETSSITGEISARVQSDLSFRVSGRIVERLVDVGASVKAGQVLARIDAEEQKADLDVATANLQSAEAQQTQAQLAFDRQQNLFKTQVTTRADLDQAQEALLTAQGSVKSAQAQLDTARDALSYTELRADADGVITARNAEVGQVAQAAQRIFTLAHEGPRDAVFNVFESLYLGRKLENNVTVSLLSASSRKVDATVREISPTIELLDRNNQGEGGSRRSYGHAARRSVVGSFRSVPQDTIELPWSAMASKGGAAGRLDRRPVIVKRLHPSGRCLQLRDRPVRRALGRLSGEIVVADGTKFLRPGEVVSYDKGAAQ